ncbi:MAG: acyl-CoA thioesterase [Planctomycetes bacterium]|nr:acyl-CoA thioesterase [Planctomycetota bacterium]MBL7007825.1 acyl-CoA thioesterase [Planctomycetota bacterium]
MASHLTEYRILYRDTDSMGVLYYGRYLELFELGRTEWLRDAGLRYRDMEQNEGRMLPVTQAECRYLAPIRFDVLAQIHTAVHGWTSSTLSFSHEIYDSESGVLCATGGVELGCVGMEDWKPTRLPEVYRQLMARLVPERRHLRLRLR